MSKVSYKDAGVDLQLYDESMARLPRLMQRTFTPRVIPLEGGFAGLFQLDFSTRLFARRYKNPVLVSGTDGVGTKLNVAKRMGRHDTVGVDLVAMCVNDVICCGAEPLFFLDYVALSKDDPDLLEQIVTGISEGCIQADCALLGGETAIMPELYREGDYDLAGFCVGVVERRNLIDGSAIAPGDVVLGVASSGFHSNGFSLIRKIVFEVAGLAPDDPVPELNSTVGTALLRPTSIYSSVVRAVLEPYRRKKVVHGIAHITGGGIPDNIERLLPPRCRVQIQADAWTRSPIFAWIDQLGNVGTTEMFRVFNMGIGLALLVSPYYAESIRRTVQQKGFDCWQIGEVIAGDRAVVIDAQK